MDKSDLSKEIDFENSQFFSFAVSSALTFTVFIIIIWQIYGNRLIKGKQKKDKNWNPEWDNLPGLEAIKRVPSVLPFKFIGALPRVFPIKSCFKIASKLAQHYGDFFQGDGLGETFVILNSGPVVQQLLKSTDINHTVKSPMVYKALEPFIINGVLVSNGEFWQSERKLLIKFQSYQSLKSSMPMLNKHCKKIVNGLEEIFKDGKPHEINEFISSAFLKVISEIITGYNDDESKEYKDYFHNFHIFKESISMRVLYSWLLIKEIWWLHPQSKKYNKAVTEIMDFARRRIQENRKARSENTQPGEKEVEDPTKPNKIRCILDDLLDAGVDDRQIIDEVNTMLFGGHETGASVIHCLLFYLALNPEFQAKCRKEIDELFENPLAFKNGELTFDTINSNLKYVERCILETLRLLPPVFVFFRKLDAPLVINYEDQDILIPTGTNMAICPYVLHRKEKCFPDPEKFDPDRFLPEEVAKRHPYSYLPFSGGQRNCLGWKFAMVEMKTVIAYTLRHFKVTTTDTIEDLVMMPYATLTPAKDFLFTFTKRDVKSAA